MTPGMTAVVTIVSAIVGSGLFNLILQHHWEKNSEMTEIKNDVKEIKDSVVSINDKVDENAAILSRTHILRFDDELINGVKHSKEYFKQQLDDIDTYEKFCKSHPDFKNSYTVEAASHIKQVFEELRNRGEFCQ